MEEEGANDPGDEGNFRFDGLPRRPAEFVFPSGERTEETRETFDAHEYDREKVDKAEGPVAKPDAALPRFVRSGQTGDCRPGEDCGFARYAEKKKDKMRDEDPVREKAVWIHEPESSTGMKRRARAPSSPHDSSIDPPICLTSPFTIMSPIPCSDSRFFPLSHSAPSSSRRSS